MANEGNIDVHYDKSGEILSVKSKSGAKIAMKVILVFQRLLKLVDVSNSSVSS